MSVNRIPVYFLFVSFALLLPLFLFFFFPALFSVPNARFNDSLFYLRYRLTGSTRVSPYLAVFCLDDQSPGSIDPTGEWDEVLRTIQGDLPVQEAKTILIYPGSPFSYRNMENRDSSGKIFFPGLMLHCPLPGDFGIHSSVSDNAGFIPEVHGRGKPRIVDERNLFFPVSNTGIANLFPDGDGVVRRLPLFFQSREGYYFPSLFLAVLCHYFNVDLNTIEIKPGKVRLPSARFRMIEEDIIIPVDNAGQMVINYPGPLEGSFDLLSVKKLLELEISVPGKLASSPGYLFLAGDVSTWGGKFSPGIYNIIYPDMMILASAFNTVFTGHFLTTGGIFEMVILYIPVLVLLNLFLFTSTQKDLSFFIYSLPIVIVLMFIYIIPVQLFLFIISRWVSSFLLPLLAGLPAALFLLIIFRLLCLKKPEPIPEKDEGEAAQWIKSEEEKNAHQHMQSGMDYSTGKETIRDALRTQRITSSSQVKISLYLLKGLSYKEIAYDLRISHDAVTQRIYKIYRKCNVHNRAAFFNKIYKLIKDTHFPYPPV